MSQAEVFSPQDGWTSPNGGRFIDLHDVGRLQEDIGQIAESLRVGEWNTPLRQIMEVNLLESAEELEADLSAATVLQLTFDARQILYSGIFDPLIRTYASGPQSTRRHRLAIPAEDIRTVRISPNKVSETVYEPQLLLRAVTPEDKPTEIFVQDTIVEQPSPGRWYPFKLQGLEIVMMTELGEVSA